MKIRIPSYTFELDESAKQAWTDDYGHETDKAIREDVLAYVHNVMLAFASERQFGVR